MKKHVKTEIPEIQRMIKNYYKYLYENKLENIEEISIFLETQFTKIEA